MVDSSGGYYGAAFQGVWGVTQGDPMYPTIFNVVVDALLRHCISLVSGGVGGQYGWGREVLHRAAFL